jgi:ATP-binding protein involved in chromosome partitioning
MASMMHQRVSGVIENMSFLVCPHCGPEHQIEIFGSGGGDAVAATLSARFGYDVPVIGRIPIELGLRIGGDAGTPIVTSEPDSPAAQELQRVAQAITAKGRGLAGMQLGLSPAGR